MAAFEVGGRQCGHGFDWSQWQTQRDLGAIAATQDFAVFKASEGDTFRDPAFRAHVTNADARDLLHGTYHFARPDWSDGGPYQDGRQEARLILSLLPDTARFVVLDLEATVLDAFNTTEYVRGFWDQVIETGRFPVLEQRVTYVGKFFNWYHSVAVAGMSVLWIPWYTAGYAPDVNPSQIAQPGWSADLWPEGWSLWQYSSSGTVAGIHPSDVNVATWQWLDAVKGDVRIPEPFIAPKEEHMAQPIWRLVDNGAEFMMVDDPGSTTGFAWRHLLSSQQINDQAANYRVNPAAVVNLGVEGSVPWDEMFARHPIQNGPHARPSAGPNV